MIKNYNNNLDEFYKLSDNNQNHLEYLLEEQNLQDKNVNFIQNLKLLNTLEQFQSDYIIDENGDIVEPWGWAKKALKSTKKIVEKANPVHLWNQAIEGIEKEVKKIVTKAIEPIKNVGEVLKSEVEDTLNEISNNIKDTFNGFINTVKTEINNTINIIKNTINEIVENTVKIINDIIKNFKIYLETVVYQVKNRITTAFNKIINEIQSKINSAINSVTKTVKNAIDKIDKTCLTEINKVIQKIESEKNKVEKQLNKLFKKMKKLVSNQANNMKKEVEDFIDLIKTQFNNLKNIIEGVIDDLKKIAIDLYNGALELIQKAEEKFKELIKDAEKAIVDIKNFAKSNIVKFIEVVNDMFDEGPINYIIREYEDWSGYQAKGMIIFLTSNFIFMNLYMFPWGTVPCKIAEGMTIKNVCFYAWIGITLFYYYIVYFVIFKKNRVIRTKPLHERIFDKVVVQNCNKIKKFTFISCAMWVNLLYILTIWGFSRKFISNSQIVYSITGLSSIVIPLRQYIL